MAGSVQFNKLLQICYHARPSTWPWGASRRGMVVDVQTWGTGGKCGGRDAVVSGGLKGCPSCGRQAVRLLSTNDHAVHVIITPFHLLAQAPADLAKGTPRIHGRVRPGGYIFWLQDSALLRHEIQTAWIGILPPPYQVILLPGASVSSFVK